MDWPDLSTRRTAVTVWLGSRVSPALAQRLHRPHLAMASQSVRSRQMKCSAASQLRCDLGIKSQDGIRPVSRYLHAERDGMTKPQIDLLFLLTSCLVQPLSHRLQLLLELGILDGQATVGIL